MSSFDYTSRDYLTIRQDLLDRASQVLPEWTTRNRADFGVLMVDLWAYMGDVLHYYIDRAAAEAYLGTATQKGSVLAIANLLDYKPLFQTSSTGTVTVTAVDPNHTVGFNIPVGTGFVAPATDNNPVVYFTSTQSASMGPSVTAVSIPVAEGQLVSAEAPINSATRIAGVSNGSSSQRFNLRFTGVVASSVEVYVYEGPVVEGGATPVSYFYSSNISSTFSNSQSFTLETSADGITQVIFGDGVNGKIPTNGATISVNYRKGIGYKGNIEKDRISSFGIDTNFDGLYIAESTATAGGSDIESIESMRANIPLMFRTQDRAVSVQDFKDLALRASQVAKATCDISGAPNVLLYVVPFQPAYLEETNTSLSIPETVQDNVIEYFSTRTVVGASVGVSPTVELKPVNITVQVAVQNQYVAQWVKTAVEDVIDTFFQFDAVAFDQTLSIGSFYKAIQNIEGVDYSTISRFRFNGDTAQEIYTTLTPTTNALIRKGTVSVTTTGGITGILV
jgi:hypothetical protein